MYLFKDWNKKSSKMKVLFALKLTISVISIIIIIFGFMNLVKMEITNNIVMPLLAIVLIINGLESYKENKVLSVVNFGIAIFIFYVGLSKLVGF